MAVLTSTQRTTLEKAVLVARRAAEQGAVNALQAFAVHHHEPYGHMSMEDRALRNHLRSKARLLGDHTTRDGGHTIAKLAYELAYEYWHRMLFAKFLEANDLLIHPEHEMAVSLEECEELGKEEGYEDKWVAAAYYASKMLPAIFRQDDPVLQIKYATEDRIKLEQLIEGIEEDIFQADDSLGWVYQYWQSEAKEKINNSEDKIDGERLPAVTQLFTEPYMVHFLIDNTLGAWWTARNPGIIPPVGFKYLRTLEDGTPAAGAFEGWPAKLSDITMLDPCMGSGHFVVEVFHVMAALRMQDEGLGKAAACDATIKENIHGLELDARCTQIAAFNLALAAWKFCGEYRVLPEMNLACCGIAPKGKKEDWVKLADAEPDPTIKARLKGGIERMYDLFQKAPDLGSLIDPTSIQKDAFTSDFEELEPFLERAYDSERGAGEEYNRGVIAAGIAKSGKLLSKSYTITITNVPFRKAEDLSKAISQEISKEYELGKSDIATAFLLRLTKLNSEEGTSSIVIPQSFLYKDYYSKLRKFLFQKRAFKIVARLGAGAFSNISGEEVKVCLVVVMNESPSINDKLVQIDITKKDFDEKVEALKIDRLVIDRQENFLVGSKNILSIDNFGDVNLLEDFADFYNGIQTGDYPRFGRYFWNLSSLKDEWVLQLTTVKETCEYGGREKCIYWENGKGQLIEFIRKKTGGNINSWIRGLSVRGIQGVAISAMGELKATLYNGEYFDDNTVVLIPKNDLSVHELWKFCSNKKYNELVRRIDQSSKVRGALLRVQFPLNRTKGEIKKPYSDDPTQWLFHGHPKHTKSPLQVSIAGLLGYEWPAASDEEMELAEEARKKIKAIHDLQLPFDEDGIVCIPPVNGEPAAGERIREQVMKIWGEEFDGNTLKRLIEQEGSKKKDLQTYLRDDFFTHHCKLFKNRPFIWHIWDGRKDGFSALVNYHKLDKANLEKLIYTYLGDWINQCQLKLQNNVSGADGLLSAASALKEKLQLILKGEPPYDLFIRWKPLEAQPIGWEPDINDGVRLNIYPFVQAGVLRKKFNVKWGKDRGKNPTGSPWGPDRYNRYEDLDEEWQLKDENRKIIPHLTTEVKRKAREDVETI